MQDLPQQVAQKPKGVGFTAQAFLVVRAALLVTLAKHKLILLTASTLLQQAVTFQSEVQYNAPFSLHFG